jgi:hypothetical protein
MKFGYFADKKTMKKALIQSTFILLALSLCGCFDEPTRNLDQPGVVYAFPNPARNTGYVSVNNTSNDMGTLNVFDPEGKIVLDENVPPGFSDFPLALESEGKYHVVCKIAGQRYTTTILRF